VLPSYRIPGVHARPNLKGAGQLRAFPKESGSQFAPRGSPRHRGRARRRTPGFSSGPPTPRLPPPVSRPATGVRAVCCKPPLPTAHEHSGWQAGLSLWAQGRSRVLGPGGRSEPTSMSVRSHSVPPVASHETQTAVVPPIPAWPQCWRGRGRVKDKPGTGAIAPLTRPRPRRRAGIQAGMDGSGVVVVRGTPNARSGGGEWDLTHEATQHGWRNRSAGRAANRTVAPGAKPTGSRCGPTRGRCASALREPALVQQSEASGQPNLGLRLAGWMSPHSNCRTSQMW
jgi:hypothetical protein